MPARPWYPKYVADYAIDTRSLTFEQHGLYNLILDQLWLNECLPDNGREIAEVIGKDPRSTDRIYLTIRHYFHLNGGQIKHKKMEKLKKEAEEISTARKNAANTRWKDQSQA